MVSLSDMPSGNPYGAIDPDEEERLEDEIAGSLRSVTTEENHNDTPSSIS